MEAILFAFFFFIVLASSFGDWVWYLFPYLW